MASRGLPAPAGEAAIPTVARPCCPICGDCGGGEPAFAHLRDRLYGAPGTWSVRRCANAACGLLWLDPAPRLDALGDAYRDYYTHGPTGDPPLPQRRAPLRGLARRMHASVRRGYHALRYGGRGASAAELLLGCLAWLHPGRRADFDFDAFYLRAQPGARILDVGCGSGRVLAALAELGWEVEGLDTDAAAVRAVRARGFRASVGDLAAQRHPDGAFRALAASHVLEHVPDPVGFVRECARVVAPGGRLVLVTPNADGLGARRFGRAWRGLEPPRHLHLFTPRALERVAREAGLGDFRVRTTVRNARGVLLASRAIARAEARGLARVDPDPPDVAAELWQLLAWLVTLARPGLGEELVLDARSPQPKGRGWPRPEAADARRASGAG